MGLLRRPADGAGLLAMTTTLPDYTDHQHLIKQARSRAPQNDLN